MMDIHSHSSYSDGSCRPEEIVALAVEKQLNLISLTDHDTIGGQQDFLAAAKAAGIHALSGLEADSRCAAAGEGCEIHLLAYGFSLADARMEKLLDTQRKRRNQRNHEIVKRLDKLGFPVHLAQQQEDQVINRLHIAQALVAAGHAESVQDAFKHFLGPEGVARLDSEKIYACDYIDLVHQLGGLVVWAHPLLMRGDWEKALNQLCRLGLDGIEVYYPAHRTDGVAKLRKAAIRRKLMITAGSDFHGANRAHVPFGVLAELADVDPLIRETEERLTELAGKQKAAD